MKAAFPKHHSASRMRSGTEKAPQLCDNSPGTLVLCAGGIATKHLDGREALDVCLLAILTADAAQPLSLCALAECIVLHPSKHMLFSKDIKLRLKQPIRIPVSASVWLCIA